MKTREKINNRFIYDDDEGLEIISREKDVERKEDVKKSESTEKIKGGMSDNKSLKEIAQKHDVDIDDILKQLELGIKVEMEHTDDPKVAIEIAKDHLCEFPTYYTELDKMEQSLKQKAK